MTCSSLGEPASQTDWSSGKDAARRELASGNRFRSGGRQSMHGRAVSAACAMCRTAAPRAVACSSQLEIWRACAAHRDGRSVVVADRALLSL